MVGTSSRAWSLLTAYRVFGWDGITFLGLAAQRRGGRARHLSAPIATGKETMRGIKWLALLPFVGMLGGVFFVNRVTPLVLGMPLLLAWIVLWVLLTSVIMALIYATDPVNRGDAGRDAAGRNEAGR
jgi:uncharacterized protein DUF3311